MDFYFFIYFFLLSYENMQSCVSSFHPNGKLVMLNLITGNIKMLMNPVKRVVSSDEFHDA